MTRAAEGATAPIVTAAPSALSEVPTGQGEESKVGLDEALVNAFPVPPVRVGMYRTQDHRYFWNGEGPLPSVTTVLDVIHRWAVTEHIAKETARAILTAPHLYLGPIDEAIKRARAKADEQRDRAASIGTGVHHYADMVPRSPSDGLGAFEIPEEYQPYLEAYRSFLDRYSRSSIVSSEKAVFGHGYAGTYDLLMQIDGDLWLIDIKTGGSEDDKGKVKGPGYYPEHALQLAAYGFAEWIGLENDPTKYPMPQVKAYGVLHLRPERYTDTGWRLIQYPVTERDYVAFLAALELYQWQQEGRFTQSILKKAMVKGEVTETGAR